MSSSISKIQKIWRGYIIRKKQLPLVLQTIQKDIGKLLITLSNQSSDGRINSALDEVIIIDSIISLIGNKRIKVAKDRMWYDIQLHDFQYGWIPVNIKTSAMKSPDNSGNLAMCVYAYTDFAMDLDTNYHNGKMSRILLSKLKKRNINMTNRDYYFLVVNKLDKSIVVNSIRGLSKLYPNSNNLPFQICWNDNLSFRYKPLIQCIYQFVDCIKQTKLSWKEQFISSIHLITVDSKKNIKRKKRVFIVRKCVLR